ncbi:hypothetical protein ACQP2E_19260 [Actinoplanes sp. CA-015351]|uniref:hypothetical protein n=1 Tax=Actinoplanes sp. CA-015351 TaxID=3239897 RepID=UPI003D98633D
MLTAAYAVFTLSPVGQTIAVFVADRERAAGEARSRTICQFVTDEERALVNVAGRRWATVVTGSTHP